MVDGNDPGFLRPTKFIGSGYPADIARQTAQKNDWTVRQDGENWRRVVASPRPQRIVELDAAEILLQNQMTVILAGGGGVPVTEGPSGLTGVEAVVDKDFTAALIATQLRADLLVMLTDVPAVYADFGTADQRPLHTIGLTDLDELSFPAGSMGPKVAAARLFVEATKRRAAIGSLDETTAVVAGTAGTQLS